MVDQAFMAPRKRRYRSVLALNIKTFGILLQPLSPSSMLISSREGRLCHFWGRDALAQPFTNATQKRVIEMLRRFLRYSAPVLDLYSISTVASGSLAGGNVRVVSAKKADKVYIGEPMPLKLGYGAVTAMRLRGA